MIREKEQFARAFQNASMVINDVQAAALAKLMADGKHTGTTLPDTTPPTSVALVAIGERESLGDRPLKHPLTREYVPDPEHPEAVAMGSDPMAHTICAIAEDGRWWQIVRMGICWPGEFLQRATEGTA